MTVKELNRDELIELKQHYYSEKHKNVSYGELVAINELVTDNEIFKKYENIEFTLDDFFCNSNNEERKKDFINYLNDETYKEDEEGNER